jgi:restriction endonuclease Mrr
MANNSVAANAREIITSSLKEYAHKHGAVKRNDLFQPAIETLKLTKAQMDDKHSGSLYCIYRSLTGSIINELIDAGLIKIKTETQNEGQKKPKVKDADETLSKQRKIIFEYLSEKYITEKEKKEKSENARINILKSIINDKNNKNELEQSREHAIDFVEKKLIKAAKIDTAEKIEFPNTLVGTSLRNQHEKYEKFLQQQISSEDYQKSLHETVIDVIKKNGGPFFEKLSLDLIKAIYGKKHVVANSDKITGGSNDHGIDAELKIKDCLGFEEKLVIQSKLGGNGASGEKAVREFMGSMDFVGAQKGVFITASPMDSKTKEFGKSTARTARRLLLIDKNALLARMEENSVGIIRDALGHFIIDKDYFII